MMENDNIVSRVIFSEASEMCSDEERFYVASVIHNRIKHPGFGSGKLLTMCDVVMQAHAFSCVNDVKNTNWTRSASFLAKPPTDPNTSQVWKYCQFLGSENHLWESGIVYYHDSTIAIPSSWNNKWWKTKLVSTTEHFSFYSIEAVK